MFEFLVFLSVAQTIIVSILTNITGDTGHADQRHLVEPHGGLRLPRRKRGLQRLLFRCEVMMPFYQLSVPERGD